MMGNGHTTSEIKNGHTVSELCLFTVALKHEYLCIFERLVSRGIQARRVFRAWTQAGQDELGWDLGRLVHSTHVEEMHTRTS